MKKLIMIFFFIKFTAYGGRYPKLDPSWFTCNSDIDCVVSYDECGYQKAVNQKYLEIFNMRAKKLGPMVNCVLRNESPKSPLCKNLLCSLKTSVIKIKTH